MSFIHDIQKRAGASFLSLFLIFSFGANQVFAADPLKELRERFVQEAQKKPLPAVRYIPNREYDLRHVALDLRFDWNAEQVIGTAALNFAPLLADTRRVSFDAAKMQINAVKLSSGAGLKFDYDEAKDRLQIELDRIYQPSESLTVVVDYRTKQTATETGNLGSGSGIKFIKPSADKPNYPRQIWSQGQPEYNKYWFPAFDHPSDFRTVELRATVEKPFTVISNGKLISTVDNANDTRTFHWKTDVPHANYLTSIVVGEYAALESKYENVPVVSYVYPNETAEGKITTSRLPAMVAHFSEITGVKYPYNKYVQTMVKEFGGAMENITATTMTDNIIHDERMALDGNQDDIQAHELAHQWFGDYLTCRDWSDIWLNESWATFMEAVWKEKNEGLEAALFEMKGNQDAYFNTWKQGLRRPVVTKNYANPDAVFDAYAYPRGGATLNMLRRQLGEKNFWRAVNYYLKKYANQNVTTDDFRAAIEESTGQSMDAFFDQWIYKMGHPVFEVTKNYDAASQILKLNVKQTQKRDETSDYPQVEFFQTPVEIEIGTQSSVKVERIQIEPKAEQTISIAVDGEPALVNWDYQNTLIDEVKFEKSVDELAYQLKTDADAMGRWWALSELKNKLRAANTPDSDKQKAASALSGAIAADKFWMIRRDAVNAVAPPAPQGLGAILAGNSGNIPKPNFSTETQNALLAALKDEKSNVRAAAVFQLGRLKDAKYADRFAAALSDRSYSVIDQAATALGTLKTEQSYEQISRLLDQKSWRDRVRVAALNGLAATGDKRAKETGFKYVGKMNSAELRAAALGLLAESGKGDERVFPLLLENFKIALDSGDFANIFNGFASFSKLGDARGQQAFDLAKAKFKSNQNLSGFINQFEAAFQQNLSAPKPGGGK